MSSCVNQAEASYPVTYDPATFPDPGFTLNPSQERALEQCFQAEGIVAIEGGYSSGKTSLVPLISWGLLQAEAAIREEKKRQLQSDVARTYTIEEMLANADDSDEEMYDTTRDTRQVSRNQYPWYQSSYLPVFDLNEGLIDNHPQGYPIAEVTDHVVALRPKKV